MADDPPGLAPEQLEGVWVLLLRHEAAAGAVSVGQRNTLGVVVDDEVFRELREVRKSHRRPPQVLGHEVSVANRVLFRKRCVEEKGRDARGVITNLGMPRNQFLCFPVTIENTLIKQPAPTTEVSQKEHTGGEPDRTRLANETTSKRRLASSGNVYTYSKATQTRRRNFSFRAGMQSQEKDPLTMLLSVTAPKPISFRKNSRSMPNACPANAPHPRGKVLTLGNMSCRRCTARRGYTRRYGWGGTGSHEQSTSTVCHELHGPKYLLSVASEKENAQTYVGHREITGTYKQAPDY